MLHAVKGMHDFADLKKTLASSGVQSTSLGFRYYL